LTLAYFLSHLGIAAGWFALLWLINIIPGLLLSFQRDNWLSNIVPRSSLGRYLGQRLAIKSAFYLGAFIFLGYILDYFGKDILAGFAVVFTVAVVVGLIDFIIFTFMSEKTPAEKTIHQYETGKFSLASYLNELKVKKLDKFIYFSTFFQFTVGLSGPLYAVYMLNELHFSYLGFTMIISAEFLARVISAPFWGRFADKVGNIRVLGIVTRIIPALPICWIFCHHIGYLVFIQILSGACWGAFDLCTQSYLYKVAPPSRKLRYIVYTRFLILICAAAGGLLGAFCVNDIFPVFGSKILSIFLISGLARILVVLYLMPKLVDLAVTFGQPVKPQEIDPDTLNRILNSKHGLYYKHEKQTQYATAGLQQTGLLQSSAASKPTFRRKPAPVRSSLLIPDTAPVSTPMSRLSNYRETMAERNKKTAIIPIHFHSLETNASRLEMRHELENQIKALSRRAEEAMSFHCLEENETRLKQRYHVGIQKPAFGLLKEKALYHHEIGQNIERLKQRYHFAPQPITADSPIEKFPDRASNEAALLGETKTETGRRKESVDQVRVTGLSAGLYRDKVSWARYMKETLDATLQELRPGQVAPVIQALSLEVPGRVSSRELPSINFKRVPVLI
jgi:MFS family permease